MVKSASGETGANVAVVSDPPGAKMRELGAQRAPLRPTLSPDDRVGRGGQMVGVGRTTLGLNGVTFAKKARAI